MYSVIKFKEVHIMGDYTDRKQQELYEGKWSVYDTSDDDYTEMVEYLNSSDFRTFGEGLTFLISKRINDDELPLNCLKRCFNEKDIDFEELGSKNTPGNWLNKGERPPKGEASRRKMFVLAFALGLNADETAYLFQRVFLDRAFNPRNYKELIYYYCIENGFSLSKAEEMISQVVIDKTESKDETIYTKMLASIINDTKNDVEIIEYINSYPHNFSINNVAAKSKVEEYILKAKRAVWNEIVIKYEFVSGEIFEVKEKKQISYDDYISMNLDRDKLIIPYHYIDAVENNDLTSINFIYKIITELHLENGKGTGASPFKNANLPKEISSSFPTPHIFSKIKKEPTYDELRKMLILLFSYCHWREGIIPNKQDRIDYFVVQINDVLTDANLPELYPGNPFDWLFYFCAMSDSPLDTLRAILFEVTQGEE